MGVKLVAVVVVVGAVVVEEVWIMSPGMEVFPWDTAAFEVFIMTDHSVEI